MEERKQDYDEAINEIPDCYFPQWLADAVNTMVKRFEYEAIGAKPYFPQHGAMPIGGIL